jgi:pimeloyl-ACP methyl ester carboxylesterase
VREIIHLTACGAPLVGTYHPAQGHTAQTGFLFLNFGYVPRDGHGGLAARASDRLAARGFPCFRVDLPSLGDSRGDLPDDSNVWFDEVRAGDHAPYAIAIIAELRARYGLRGVVVGGLCAAAITALYAVDRDDPGISGVALLEPELYISPRIVDPEATGKSVPPPPPPPIENTAHGARGWIKSKLRSRRVTERLFSYWGWMRVLTGDSPYAKYLPVPRRLISAMLMLQKDKLPDVTNYPVVACWRRAVERRVPMLVVTAEGKMRELFFDRVNAVVLANADMRSVTRVRLAGTNHIFTTGGAIDAVGEALIDWGSRNFT